MPLAGEICGLRDASAHEARNFPNARVIPRRGDPAGEHKNLKTVCALSASPKEAWGPPFDGCGDPSLE